MLIYGDVSSWVEECNDGTQNKNDFTLKEKAMKSLLMCQLENETRHVIGHEVNRRFGFLNKNLFFIENYAKWDSRKSNR